MIIGQCGLEPVKTRFSGGHSRFDGGVCCGRFGCRLDVERLNDGS
jgi:hypothetical protein